MANQCGGEEKGGMKMPLTFAAIGAENIIQRIGGTPAVKAHIEQLGFVVGGAVKVLHTIGGNVIVSVKGCRIAISRELAQKIWV